MAASLDGILIFHRIWALLWAGSYRFKGEGVLASLSCVAQRIEAMKKTSSDCEPDEA
jgi:hypothetical protein